MLRVRVQSDPRTESLSGRYEGAALLGNESSRWTICQRQIALAIFAVGGCLDVPPHLFVTTHVAQVFLCTEHTRGLVAVTNLKRTRETVDWLFRYHHGIY